MKRKKWPAALMGLLLLMFAVLPATAFGADAANSGTVELKLKSGQPSMQINGQTSAILAPYETSGTTMVPLRVITEAFKAGIDYQKGVIRLKYNDRNVVLTIGSKDVTVNGTVKQVAVAPVLVNNSTFVPLRVIVEAFGAKVDWNQTTKAITITGSLQSEALKRIGSSYEGYSIKDPKSYGLTDFSSVGSFAAWSNEDMTTELVITTDIVDQTFTSSELRQQLKDSWFEEDEQSIAEQTVTVNGTAFETIYSVFEDSVVQYRTAQKGDMVYTAFVVTDGSSASDLAPYEELLNSLTLSFDKATAADIVVPGDVHADYGDSVTAVVPGYWAGSSYDQEGGDFYLFHDGYFSISLLDEEDTADFEQEDDIAASELVPLPSIKISGKNAEVYKQENEEENGTNYFIFVENGSQLIVIQYFIGNGQREQGNLQDVQRVLSSIQIKA
ncbi:stalk domain-containing protein [Paenibacillus protaetiae]|uniref:Copper amine oxidase-like N-terminal domain-containing protein n=1 Tax=Paenibacillus protaetiae TaxID=2509456 RepID=A0A4V0YFI3_9BACL|nr:stalk domain-containing protein [Paenibacillus protaetiae]QAY67811.1 hypothetical protein ET464_16860 [Paenibacillus protaetiae]